MYERYTTGQYWYDIAKCDITTVYVFAKGGEKIYLTNWVSNVNYQIAELSTHVQSSSIMTTVTLPGETMSAEIDC